MNNINQGKIKDGEAMRSLIHESVEHFVFGGQVNINALGHTVTQLQHPVLMIKKVD